MPTRTVLASVNRRPQGGLDSPEQRNQFFEDTEFWVRRAARMGARMLAFTEVYPQLCHPGDGMYEHVEPAEGGTLPRIAEMAKKYDLDIVWPRFERDGRGTWNVSIYIDRHGNILGRYRKMFPTLGEMDHGVLPGDGGVCVEAEFGRVGFAICFDLNFPELLESYRGMEPDVIVFSSMYRGGIQLQEWAVALGTFMVSSCPGELGRIVDRGGKVVALATYEALITAPVNLNSVQLHMDYNWEKMDRMLEKYGPELRFDFYTQEARYVISSERTPIRDIIREFDLLEREEYFRRVRARRRKILESPPNSRTKIDESRDAAASGPLRRGKDAQSPRPFPEDA